MKKPMWKRLVSLTAALCMAACMMTPAVSAEGGVYVALGDSITTGYAPGGTEESPNRVDSPFTEQLAQARGLSLDVSLAKDGLTSSELLETLTAIANNPFQNPQTAMNLARAEVITITIGGNDLMNALYSYLAAQYAEEVPGSSLSAEDIKENILTGDQQILSFAAEHLAGFMDSAELRNAISTFTENLVKIVVGLKQANPAAKIVIANQYNPYTTLKELAELFQSYLPEGYYDMISTLYTTFESGVTTLNQIIETIRQEYPLFAVADVCSEFRTSEVTLCNAGLNSDFSLSLDFHPNQAGHAQIAETIGNTLDSYTVEYYLLTQDVTGQSVPRAIKEGVPVELSAPSRGGMHFTNWTVKGVAISDLTQSSLQFSMPSANVTVTANYEEHTPEADDGDCTTAVKCSVCGAIVIAAYDSHDLTHHPKQDPTQTAVGWEAYDTCSRCDYTTYIEIPMLPTYTILEGDKSHVEAGADNTIRIKASGDVADFVELKIDGATVGQSNYTVESGSTIVVLKKEYVNSLAAGTHTMTFVYKNGEVSATFTISEKSSSSAPAGSDQTTATPPAESTSTNSAALAATPQTGDGSHVALWGGMLMFSACALAVVCANKRREN